MPSSKYRFLATGLITAVLVLSLAGMTLSKPNTLNRDSIPEKYKWDLSDIYPDFEAWDADMTKLKTMMDEYAALKGTLGDGPQALLKAKMLYDELDQIVYLVYRYPGLASALDSRDNEMAGKFQQVLIRLSEFEVATSWFDPELLAIPWETMAGWLNETEELAAYRFGIENLYRQQEHVLSEDKEKLLSYFSQSNSTAGNVYRELTTSDIKYAETALSDGDSLTMTPGQYYSILSSNRNQDDRRAAFEAFYGVYQANVNSYAAIYNGVLQRDWANAQARNYNSTLEAYLDNDNVPVAIYENLVNTIRNGSEPLQRYLKLRKEALGVEEYHFYDGSIPVVDFDKKYPYDDIIDWIIEAMEPLGKDYQGRLRQAFDNRWIDVYENDGKRTGAFSAGVYGVHPYLLLNYNETLDNVFTVAHEIGHAMHTILSHESQPYATADYTIFVAEVASTLNEALLLEYLFARTEDPIERIALLQQAIGSITGTVYTQSMWADFEWRAHQMAEQGKPVTAESIREVYSTIIDDYYGDAVLLDDYYRSTWTRIGHFYRSPYYVYKYATSFAASAAIFKEITSDDKQRREAGLEGYLNLLKSGGNDYPVDQLKKAGVDLTKPETIQAVVDQLDVLVTRLAEEMAKIETGRQ